MYWQCNIQQYVYFVYHCFGYFPVTIRSSDYRPNNTIISLAYNFNKFRDLARGLLSFYYTYVNVAITMLIDFLVRSSVEKNSFTLYLNFATRMPRSTFTVCDCLYTSHEYSTQYINSLSMKTFFRDIHIYVYRLNIFYFSI